MSDVVADVATPQVGGVAEAQVDKSVPAKEVMPKTKMKINGTEREYSFEELKLLASKSVGSNEKFDEAARMRKDVEDNVLSPLKQRQLVKALESQGFSRKEAMEVLEEQLAAMYDEEAMDPKDKLIKDFQEKEAKRQQEEETVKERQAREKEESEIQHEIEAFETEMFEALTRSELPKDPSFARAAALKMKAAEQKGIELSANDAVKLVEADFMNNLQSILPKLGVKQLKKFLGEQAIKDILNDSTSALKEASAPFGKPSNGPRQEHRGSKKEEGPKESMRDYFIKLKSGK